MRGVRSRSSPDNAAAAAQVASTEVEFGRYDDANALLRTARSAPEPSVAVDTASARYDELNGNLASARRSIDRALTQTDSIMDTPAESRAWFHFRAGELAWAAGDGATAERRFREALDLFPNYARARNGLARIAWGQRRWPETLDSASRAAKLVPLPETLGYLADAQRALGDTAAARRRRTSSARSHASATPAVSTTARWRCTLPITAAASATRSRSRAATSPRATTCLPKTPWPGRSPAAAAGAKRATRHARPFAETRKTHACNTTPA